MELILLLFIQLLMIIIVLLCFAFNETKPIQSLIRKFTNIYRFIMPKFIRKWLSTAYEYLFYGRNKVFMYSYMLLVLLGNSSVYAVTSNVLDFTSYVTTFLIVLHLIAFQKLSKTDPGVINRNNIDFYGSIYGFYEQVFDKDGNPGDPGCKYCDLKQRPRRSKHCFRCDHCVHRFDHHCVWTNSCIGGCNTGAFMIWLCTILIMLANASLIHFQQLYIHTVNKRIWSAYYLDSNGKRQPMDWNTLILHLIFHKPLSILGFVMLASLFVLLTCFTLYLHFLVMVNTTGFERSWSQKQKSKVPNYDKGVWKNLIEVYWHHSCVTDHSKNR